MTDTTYFWDHDNYQVLQGPCSSFWREEDILPEYQNRFAVDAGDVAPGRYGMFVSDVYQLEWVNLPFSAFPKEFKAALLLLGVS